MLLSVLIMGMAGYGVIEYKTRMKPDITGNSITRKSDGKDAQGGISQKY